MMLWRLYPYIVVSRIKYVCSYIFFQIILCLFYVCLMPSLKKHGGHGVWNTGSSHRKTMENAPCFFGGTQFDIQTSDSWHHLVNSVHWESTDDIFAWRCRWCYILRDMTIGRVDSSIRKLKNHPVTNQSSSIVHQNKFIQSMYQPFIIIELFIYRSLFKIWVVPKFSIFWVVTTTNKRSHITISTIRTIITLTTIINIVTYCYQPVLYPKKLQTPLNNDIYIYINTSKSLCSNPLII